MTPATTDPWSAWFRPSGRRVPWKPLASWATEAVAQLRSHRLRLSGDWLVRETGAGDPNGQERR